MAEDMQYMTPKMCCLTASGNTNMEVGGWMRRVAKMSADTLPLWFTSFCTSGIMTWDMQGQACKMWACWRG